MAWDPDPDRDRIATASSDTTVRLWNATTGVPELVLHGHTNPVWHVRFSADGSRLASASLDGSVRVWALDLDDLIEIATNEVTRTLTDAECRQFLHTTECSSEAWNRRRQWHRFPQSRQRRRPLHPACRVGDPLTGIWATGELTCAQEQAAVEAAGFTAAQLASVGWVPDCGAQFTLRFAAGGLVQFEDGEIRWAGKYRIIDEDTFEAGDKGGTYYITYRYAIDGDQLTIDMVEDNYLATSEAGLLGELLAQTEIYETSPFTRQD